MLLNEQKIFIFKFALIMYNFYKTNIDNEKFLKKSLFNTSKSIKKSLKKLTIFIITFNLLITMKEKYENDNIL